MTRRTPPPAQTPSTAVSNATIHVAGFAPAAEHCRAIEAIAQAIAANAAAAAALAATLTPPASLEVAGMKILPERRT